MKVVENNCVGCKDMGLPCIGSSCPNREVEVAYCDICENRVAIYQMNDYDYCEDCAEEILSAIFEEKTLVEKAKLLDIELISC